MKMRVILEFSERWLKAIVFKPQGARKQAAKIIAEPLEPGAEDFSGALNKVFSGIGQRRGVEVAVCLSRSKMTVRKIDLPSREPDEIEQMLGLHVIRQVPYPKEEIIWSHQNLGFDGINTSSVLLAIIQREIPNAIFNALTRLNILPEKILMSSQGVVYYIQDYLKSDSLLWQPCLALDIDYNVSDLILIKNGQLASTVVIDRGAEQLKTEHEKDRYCVELRQALLAFGNDLPVGKPVQLFLTGAAGNIADLKGYFDEEFNLRMQILEPKDITGGAGLKGISFGAVLGFAAQDKKESIVFTLPEIQIKKEIRVKLQQLLILAVCLTYIFILSGVIALVRLNQRQSYRDKLKGRIAQLKEGTGGLMDFTRRITTAAQYSGRDQSALTYLYELTRVCPDSITLTNFTWEWKKDFIIRGYAAQASDIFNFVSVLEGSKVFKGAQTRYTRRRKAKDKEAVDFEIGVK